jgi:transposase
LFGTPEIVKNIINLFEDNPRLGVLGVPLVYHGNYFFTVQNSWQGNYENTVKLSKRLGLKTELDKKNMPIFPVGDMFWFRSPALKKAIDAGLEYDDFDVKYEIDFTFMHAIERIYGLVAQDSGYYYADVINSDNARSDLVNYQYMLYKLMEIISDNGHFIYNFESAKQIFHKIKETKELLAWHADSVKKQQEYIEAQNGRIAELEAGLAWHEENGKKQQEYIEAQRERITELEAGLVWHEENSKKQQEYVEAQRGRITELEAGLMWHEENSKKQQEYVEAQRGRIIELEAGLMWHEENGKKQQEYVEAQRGQITGLEAGLAWHEENGKKQREYVEAQIGRIAELEAGLVWHEENGKKQQEYVEAQNGRIAELEAGLAWHEENGKKQQEYIEKQQIHIETQSRWITDLERLYKKS